MHGIRNFDIATLRSFVQIVEAGSMTKAAARLNLTQSAISMQIKRLETSLEQSLFERTNQKLTPTSVGEQLLHYARQLVAVNDEAWGRLTALDYEGTIRLGAPSDIINPYIPRVLSLFTRDFPKVQVQLTSDLTINLKQQFEDNLQDIILTTELNPTAGKILSTQPLVWFGAENGTAWKKRPLPLGFNKGCVFRQSTVEALERANMDWVNVVFTVDDPAKQAMISADLCVSVRMEQTVYQGFQVINHNGQLPDLPQFSIALYQTSVHADRLVPTLASYIEHAFTYT